MASTRQLKHHARFHAAVLRRLFPSSSPPPPPPPPPSYSPQEAPTDSKDQASFQVHSPESTEVALEETHTDNNEEVEAGKVLLSRAQRKRLKLKKLKERQLNAIPAKRLIGPLLSGVLEKRMLVSDDEKLADALPQENSNVEQNDISLCTRHKQGSIEIGKPEVFSTVSGEELVMPKKDYTSLCSETGEGKDIPAEVEPECLSKAKRRRLAKRRFHDSSRHSTVGSSFTAEIKGEDIIIKQIT